jgi:epoxyqueuosine reductase QueG
MCNNFKMVEKEEFAPRALALGAGDVRFADAQGGLAFSETERFDIQAMLPGATCVAVLFAPYLPAGDASEGFMPLSAYYVASHTLWRAANALEAWLKERGASALHDTRLPARAAALRTGGFIGDNGFYYHERFGSYVAIQTILTDAFAPDEFAPGENRCLHCGACAAACPSAATADLSRCLRRHINRDIPETLRGDVYQILGCEKCQSACPINPPGRSEPHIFALEELLSGKATGAVRALAGGNFVRAGRLASQAALYAAATGQKQLLIQLWALAQSAPQPVRTHAGWAYGKLGGKTP